jgi:hypothetical protein
MEQAELFNLRDVPPVGVTERSDEASIHEELRAFREFGKATVVTSIEDGGEAVPVYINEFWTAKQRAAHSLHEVSYRACFKPQLPQFFIQRFSTLGDSVYDPFGGRGTTALEAALRGRIPVSCDINPLSRILLEGRMLPPDLAQIAERLGSLPLEASVTIRDDLDVFFHAHTLQAISNLRDYFLDRAAGGSLDAVDRWIRMVATNRLTGHSPGFFSVYTLPPNQATSVVAQARINAKRNQVPPPRDVRAIILKKSRSLLSDLTSIDRQTLREAASKARMLTASADATPEIRDGSVQLVITSPPFLDVVNYRDDNWLRCWFNGIDAATLPIWKVRTELVWQERMTGVFQELRRVLEVGGWIAFEVGEVRGGKVQLEHAVIRAMRSASIQPCLVLINAQTFTKTANCWGVDNNALGTNSNRVVLGRKMN